MSEPAKRYQRDAGSNHIHNFKGVAAMAIPSLTVELLRKLLHYDPETGSFTRLVSRNNKHRVGDVAGHIKNGRVEIGIDGKSFLANRLAVFYMTGQWPQFHVDHKDGDASNNSWHNLRDVTRGVNMQNQRKPSKNNKAGLLGVYAHCGRFQACIRVNGGSRHLGTFDTPEQAHNAYLDAKRKFHEGCTI